MKTGIDRCESPLEVAFANAMAEQSRFIPRQAQDDPLEVGVYDGWAIALLAQVEIVPYRVDFLIVSYAGEDPDLKPWSIVVEIDGHDYHERTKEQARRDRSRDRVFTSIGAKVLRFTGQEVWEDAAKCASEALTLAIELQDVNLQAKFTNWLKEKAEAAE